MIGKGEIKVITMKGTSRCLCFIAKRKNIIASQLLVMIANEIYKTKKLSLAKMLDATTTSSVAPGR